DVVGPDVSEDEGPDADEDVDEDLHRRRGAEYPAFRVVDAFGGVRSEDQGFGDRAARHRRAVGLHRQPHPRARDHGFMRKERVRGKGRISSSTTAKITTSEATMIGTMGRARIAPPVAIAAETPQIEIPDASGAAHSRLKPNHLRATKYTTAQ